MKLHALLSIYVLILALPLYSAQEATNKRSIWFETIASQSLTTNGLSSINSEHGEELVLTSVSNHTTNEPTSWITIFVHGIISPKPYLTLPVLARFMHDDIDNTMYARAVTLTRDDPFFYQYHTMQERGLQKIDLSIMRPGAAATAFAKAYDSITEYSNPRKNFHHYYYTFGWSGLISPSKRYEESKKLYDALAQELAYFENKNIRPKLRIVGYSHGASLALELARVAQEREHIPEKKYIIDELVLVGAPLVPESNHCIHSPLFKKVYHFFSYSDRVQRLDFFSLTHMFSKRTFKKHAGSPPPKNLVQITIHIKRPQQGKKNVNVRSYRSLRKSDPGHSELWSFGWVPSCYRKNFPLYPLPFATFTPFLIEAINQYAENARKISIELHPYAHCMIIKNCKSKESVLPFLSSQQLTDVQEMVKPYAPENFTFETYNARICQHKNQAHREWLSCHKIKRFGHYRII